MTKVKRKIKKVTLPIYNFDIYTTLADIAWSVEPRKDKLDRKEFYESVRQELGKEAYLHSFTPSGEIGSGDSEYFSKENPQSPRIAQSFYDGFQDLMGPTGTLSKLFRSNTNSESVQKNRMFRFKSSIINLVQVYLESDMSLTTGDRHPKNHKDYLKKDRVTSFNYGERKGQSDEDWYAYLIQVESNRYVRMFVATIFFTTISELFMIKVKDMAKTIQSRDLAGVNNIESVNKKFKKLKEAPNREQFVRNVRDIFKLKVVNPEEAEERKVPVKRSRVPLTAEQKKARAEIRRIERKGSKMINADQTSMIPEDE